VQDVEIDRGSFRGVWDVEKRNLDRAPRQIEDDCSRFKNENLEVLKRDMPRARRRSPRISV